MLFYNGEDALYIYAYTFYLDIYLPFGSLVLTYLHLLFENYLLRFIYTTLLP